MTMENLYIIKIGGNVIDNPVELDNFLQQFSAIEGYHSAEDCPDAAEATIGTAKSSECAGRQGD